MATSGLTDGSMTALEIVTAAMEELGVLSSGGIPTAEEGETGKRRLNWMLKSWQGRGTNLFRETTDSVEIPALAPYGKLSPGVQDIGDVRVVSGASNVAFERQLQRFDRADFMSLPNKDARGLPTVFYAEKRIDGINLHLWPVSTTPIVLRVDYTRVAEDITDLTQTVDVPQEWTETVYMNLAARLANTFGATRVDPGAVQRVTQYAAVLERQMLDADRPSSIFMGPATQNPTYGWR